MRKFRLPDEELGWRTALFILFLAATFLAVIVWSYGCAGPYRGPDAVPDRVDVGYGWGDSVYGFQPFDNISASEDREQWFVSLGWDLAPPALPEETDARRNELIAQMLEEMRKPEPVSVDKPNELAGSETILAQLERHWVVALMLAGVLLLAGAAPVLLKRFGGAKTETPVT